MERILRSVIQVGNVPDGEECLANWSRLQEQGLGFPNEEDRRIEQYLQDFYGQMSSPPDFTLVRDFFEKRDDIETCTRLDEIKKAQHYIRTNFLSIVRTELEEQQRRQFVLVCRDAATIAEHGMNIQKPGPDGKKIMRGTSDAIGFVFDKMSDMTRFEGGEKLEGSVTDDVEEVISEYESVESADAYTGRNIFGLEPLDQACEGHKSGEFHVHCAYPGELKTTLALNYAYNNAYLHGKNIFYGIFEMPYKQLQIGRAHV